MRFKKEDYERSAHRKVRALRSVAEELGKDHPLTKLMGSMAWGRHSGEQPADRNLQTAIRAMSFVDGVYDTLNRWARDNDIEAQKILIKKYPQGMTLKDQ